MSTRARFKHPTPGTCRVCGCTDDNGCPQGCSWVDREHTLCSSCEGTPADAAYSLRWLAVLLKPMAFRASVRRGDLSVEEVRAASAHKIAAAAFKRVEAYETEGAGE